MLLAETLEALATDAAGQYIDATFGRGGHAVPLLQRLGPAARLLAIDRDPLAAAAARELAQRDARVTALQGRMSDMTEYAQDAGFDRVAGVLMDLGVSSPQLDDPARGFSFRFDAPLDMRMDNASGITAAAWLNRADEGELARVFRDYGEERYARRIARAIVQRRAGAPLATTTDLVQAVAAAQPRPDPHKHAATRVFQAVRIHVNDELSELARALDAAFALLTAGGRLAVISFHSLEDRLVKRQFRAWTQGPALPRRLPVAGAVKAAARTVVRARRAGADEVDRNPRARSALLRVVEKRSAVESGA